MSSSYNCLLCWAGDLASSWEPLSHPTAAGVDKSRPEGPCNWNSAPHCADPGPRLHFKGVEAIVALDV